MKDLIKSSGTFPNRGSKVLPVAGKPKSEKTKSRFAISNVGKAIAHNTATKNVHLPL